MEEDLADRLSYMSVEVRTALVIGDGADRLRTQLPPQARVLAIDIAASPHAQILAEEDRLPVADASCDLVFAVGTLDSVHDLPGALLLIRRCLRPGGLFLGAMMGAGSLPTFRLMVQSHEAEVADSAVARFHPQVDVRAAGDLLFRAGFSTPVADLDTVSVSYSCVRRLLGDVRAMSGNALPQIRPFPGSAGRKLLGTPPFQEQFGLLYLTGWAPEAGVKRPAGPVKARAGAD
jgi:SAM-dependent methyltransferase